MIEWATLLFEAYVALLLTVWMVLDRCHWYFLEEDDGKGDEDEPGG